MADTFLTLTDREISALPLAKTGQYFARDRELPGFAVLVGKRKKSFVVQGDIRKDGKRLSVRVKFAEVGNITTREARAEAKQLLGKITKGIDPRQKILNLEQVNHTSDELTLRQAWDRYRDSHLKRKGRGASTLRGYKDHVERLMADWLDQPISILGNDPSLVTARHDKITDENGPYLANSCMRSLRAIYNHARKTIRSLPPENPVTAVDWNRETRRNTALGLNELRAWADSLAALNNPVRREFHLLLLLSGSRPDALKRSRVEDINFSSRILHVPRPKGGEVKAFDIPLSRAMIKCLVRVIRFGRLLYPGHAQGWVFPADSASGHIAEHKENRNTLIKWGNDLRQTYRTVAQAASIPELDIHLLMNHSLPGVNAGYITRNKLLNDHLRLQQELISHKIIEAVIGKPKANVPCQRLWPTIPARRVLADVLKAVEAKDILP